MIQRYSSQGALEQQSTRSALEEGNGSFLDEPEIAMDIKKYETRKTGIVLPYA